MDEFNKKNEDDLFSYRYNETNETHEANELNNKIPDAENDAQRRTEEQRTDEHTSPYGEDKAFDTRAEEKPAASFTYGPFGTRGSESSERPQNPIEVVPTEREREYRPFTVSGNGRNWEPGKQPKGTSLKAVFASFMVGVLAVGGLMFSADRGNWFTSKELSAPAVAPVSTSSQTSGVKTAVDSTSDTVRPNNISQIFEQASPAVVKIETYVKTSSRGSSGSSFFDDNPLFRQFFGDDSGSSGDQGNGGDSGSQDNSGSLQEEGMGSGFIFDSTGYILTNQHVINGADQVKVTVTGHTEPYVAKVLGTSYDLDLAVLKIEGKDLPTLKLGDSTTSNMGDWVVAIGNPYGFDHTITVGVLSSNERKISIQDTDGTRNYQHLLQTDASINPGNSGGPLINLKGEVIGINTAVSSQAQGIGFAIPTSTITEVLENLKTNTKIPAKPSPFIGATLADVSSSVARQLGLDNTNGALVNTILYGSPAYKADLRQYDVITGMDGKTYKTKEELIEAIQKKNVGDKVTLNVYRDGKSIDLTLTIGNKSDFEEQTKKQQQ